MAIYHCSIKLVQRSKGKSAVAAAAYRSRSTLHDVRQGMTFSYTAATDLVHAEIVGFDGDRGSLWNIAEAMEKRNDATVAREYEVALPLELDTPDQIELLREFSQWLNDQYGCVVDFALHSGDGKNPHGHVLTTTRSIDTEGTMSDIKIPREWSDKKRKAHGLHGRKTEVERVRKVWADLSNQALEKAGIEARIDHRSYADQRIDRLPTSHIGPAANAMERDGLQTRAGDHNRMIGQINLKRQFELDELRKHQSEAESLQQQMADIDSQIEAIRHEPSPASTKNVKGTIAKVDHSVSIAAVATLESARYAQGIAKSIGEQYKSKLFRKTWNAEIDPRILKSLKWVDVYTRALTLKTGEQIVDNGDSVCLSYGSDNAISVAIAMAQAKGWKSVRVSGSDDFQVRAALALNDAGIEPFLTSDIARKHFCDQLQERHMQFLSEPDQKGATMTTKPPKSSPDLPSEDIPETLNDSAQIHDLDGLRDHVRRALRLVPPKQTSPFRDDTPSLRQWAVNHWETLVKMEDRETLKEVFIKAVREQAMIAGYSKREIKAIELNERWAKSIADTTSHLPEPKPRTASHQRRPDQLKYSHIAPESVNNEMNSTPLPLRC